MIAIDAGNTRIKWGVHGAAGDVAADHPRRLRPLRIKPGQLRGFAGRQGALRAPGSAVVHAPLDACVAGVNGDQHGRNDTSPDRQR